MANVALSMRGSTVKEVFKCIFFQIQKLLIETHLSCPLCRLDCWKELENMIFKLEVHYHQRKFLFALGDSKFMIINNNSLLCK